MKYVMGLDEGNFSHSWLGVIIQRNIDEYLFVISNIHSVQWLFWNWKCSHCYLVPVHKIFAMSSRQKDADSMIFNQTKGNL